MKPHIFFSPKCHYLTIIGFGMRKKSLTQSSAPTANQASHLTDHSHSHSCPVIKTVPYTCLPGATQADQCIQGVVFGLPSINIPCSGAFFGSFTLLDIRSPFCPQAKNFTGLAGEELGQGTPAPASFLLPLVSFLLPPESFLLPSLSSPLPPVPCL